MAQTASQTPNRIIGMALTLMGLFALLAGVFYGYESLMLVQNGSRTNGRVVGFHERMSDEDQQLRYAPVIEYAVDGKSYRFAGANYANSPAYNIGETLDLYYDPAKPDQARLDRFGSLWGLPAGLSIAGLIVFVIGFGLLRKKAPVQSTT